MQQQQGDDAAPTSGMAYSSQEGGWRRLGHHAFLEPDGHGEAFVQVQGAACEAHRARVDEAVGTGLLRAAEGAGVAGALLHLGHWRKVDQRRDAVDGEGPSVAVDVPVDLVMVREEAHLALGGVGDAVRVVAGWQEVAFAAHVQHEVVALRGGVVRRGCTEDLHGGEVVLHTVLPSGVVGEVQRQLANDAALERDAFRMDADLLGHRELAVGGDGEVGVPGVYLLGLGVDECTEQKRHKQQCTTEHVMSLFAEEHDIAVRGERSTSTFCFAKRWSQKATTIQVAVRLAQARSTGCRAGSDRADRGQPPHVAPVSSEMTAA
jgi:hypothetical protein